METFLNSLSYFEDLVLPDFKLLTLTKTFQEICTVDITGKCGAMNPMIKSGKVTVSAALYEKEFYLRLEYSYQHPDFGSNGYSMRRKFDSKLLKWIAY